MSLPFTLLTELARVSYIQQEGYVRFCISPRWFKPEAAFCVPSCVYTLLVEKAGAAGGSAMSKFVDVEDLAPFVLQGRALGQEVMGTEAALPRGAFRWVKGDDPCYVAQWFEERSDRELDTRLSGLSLEEGS